jgi:hypothetical protein
MIQKQPCVLGTHHQPLEKIKVKHLGEFYHVDACVMSIKSHGEAKFFYFKKIIIIFIEFYIA